MADPKTDPRNSSQISCAKTARSGAARISAQAVVRDESSTRAPRRDPEAFWARFASELEWSRPWDTVLDWQPPHAKWFVGGTINASVNCLDRHLRGPRRNKAAIIWEGEPGDRRTLTYFDLHREVCQFANVLKSLGVKKGDRVAIYLPMIPELGDRDARVRAHRRGAQRRLRRLQRRVAARPHQRRRRRGCSSPPTAAIAAARSLPLKQMADEALAEHAVDRERRRRPADRRRAVVPIDVKEGRDHWYHR